MEWKLMQPNMAGNQGIYPNSRYVMHTIVLAGSVPLTHLKISFRELGPSMAGAAERVLRSRNSAARLHNFTILSAMITSNRIFL